MATSYLFKLNNVSVNVEVAPKIIETQDETFDSATCVLEVNDNKYPIKPMTTFQVIATYDDESTENFDFYVTADNVELYSTEPLRYKHTLSLIQSSQRTNKILIRNSVFSQPAQKVKKAFWGFGQWSTNEGTVLDPNIVNLLALYKSGAQGECEIPLSINSREKIKGCPYIIITYQCGIFGPVSESTFDDIDAIQPTTYENEDLDILNDRLTALDFDLSIDRPRSGNLREIGYIYYKDSNNNSQGEPIYLSDIIGEKLEFNQPLYVPKLKTILENGGHDYYFSTKKAIQSYGTSWNSYENAFVVASSGGNIQFDVEAGYFPVFIFTQFQLCVETYYWSVWDILEKINQRYRQTSVLGNKRQPLYTLNPTSYTGELLKKTIAPNFAFTQCSLFECLSEIFRLYDATFKLKNYDEIEIEYLNSSANETDSLDFSGETRTINNDRYNSGIISYYQDARVKEIFPSKNGYVRATSKDLGVPNSNDHIFLLPHKIDNIVSAKSKVNNLSFTSIIKMENKTIDVDVVINADVSRYIIEQSIWSVADNSSNFPINGDYREVAQNNSVFYEKGDNKIDISYSFKEGWLQQTRYAFGKMLKSAVYCMCGCPNKSSILYHPDDAEWNECYIQIEYETSVDGRVKNESIVNKYDGEMLIDQYNGAVDLNKMGLNMLGLSLKMGEPTLNATHKITTLQNRIKKGTIYIDGSGKRWVANVCSYTILDNDYILGEISFTANYNALSLRTKLNRERRMTNISSDLITKSEDNYVDYIYYSSHSFSESAENIALDLSNNSTILWSFFPCINPDDGESTLDLDKVPNVAGINVSRIATLYYVFDYVPLVRYASGNSLCFEMSYESPNVSANRTDMESGWFGNNKYFTKAFKYTDDLGFIDTTTIGLFNANKITLTNYPRASKVESPLVSLNTYQLFKQPNEIFALNYQLCFLPKESEKDTIFLGRSFFENNFLVNDDVGLHKFYIVYGDGKYDILDTELIDNEDRFLMDTISVSNETNGFVIRFGHVEEDVPSGATCWALVDENDNIYIMSNKVLDERYQELHLLPRKTRL